MRPADLLFLFLPLLLPGMWADPEEPQVFQLLQTSLFDNISSAEVFGVALLGDMPIFALDPANWSIHFHWPWALQATNEGDMEKIKVHIKPFLRNMVRYVHEMAQQAQRDYPLVVQIRAGCVLKPNRTSWGFIDVGEGGKDFITFEMERQRWETRQPSPLAELVSKSLTSKKAITGLLEHLLSTSCQSHILTLCKYGRASLDRQELPVATVFARTPSPAQILLVCRVTGFYPRPISVAWLRDGQEVPPGPELNTSAILPNADLTYQLRSTLAVAPHDGHSYACRVRHHSLGTRSLLIPWGSFKLHIFQTFVFHNMSFADTSAWATLEDIVFATMQKYTGNILYLHPWVYPALPAAEWENLKNLFSVYIHNFILSLSNDARLYQTPYPFVFQCMTGCDLYPNGSYTKFYHLAYNAHNFLSFNIDNIHWERQQESQLAAQVERQFNTFTGFSETLQHLLNVTCVDHMKKLIEYGKAALERQELPVATVFARTLSPAQILLVCRVTGFYPRPISVAWLRDGQEVPPGPELNTSAILPNADLTYQLRSTLAVAPHDGHSYACHVRHHSLGTRSLLIPWGSSKVALSVSITIVVLLTMAAALAGAIWHYRHRC
ncbi:antigen-presenting glycoprotein CD1d-like isoform X2 [Tyto alba]|uniref:antigen-presenting glycoprotein CD1d-like isoform X2 n=1 Tax=Tyto alba TaxID=56313 RepID=UPI001C66B2D6|nr:antigen-presenting glycoprotein CD1d-like isoform X2 [Tyto alba]